MGVSNDILVELESLLKQFFNSSDIIVYIYGQCGRSGRYIAQSHRCVHVTKEEVTVVMAGGTRPELVGDTCWRCRRRPSGRPSSALRLRLKEHSALPLVGKSSPHGLQNGGDSSGLCEFSLGPRGGQGFRERRELGHCRVPNVEGGTGKERPR